MNNFPKPGTLKFKIIETLISQGCVEPNGLFMTVKDLASLIPKSTLGSVGVRIGQLKSFLSRIGKGRGNGNDFRYRVKKEVVDYFLNGQIQEEEEKEKEEVDVTSSDFSHFPIPKTLPYDTLRVLIQNGCIAPHKKYMTTTQLVNALPAYKPSSVRTNPYRMESYLDSVLQRGRRTTRAYRVKKHVADHLLSLEKVDANEPIEDTPVSSSPEPNSQYHVYSMAPGLMGDPNAKVHYEGAFDLPSVEEEVSQAERKGQILALLGRLDDLRAQLTQELQRIKG